ncbi:MAG: DUF5706 domain-containing protein [Bacteroidales bacterium]
MTDLVKEAELFVKNLFVENKNELLLFHNLGYIKSTVGYAEQLCEMEKVSDSEKEIILVAGWLFSTGYLFDYKDFKKQGLKTAETFLSKFHIDSKKTENILSVIEVVLFNKPCENIYERILYDASEFYLAADDFLLWVKYHRKERNYFLTPKLTKRSFWQTVQVFLNEHKFVTVSGNNLFKEGKEKNESKIKLVLTQELTKELPVNNHMLIEEMRQELNQINLRIEKRLSSYRGFDTLYRLTSRNQVNLSSIADNKSHILISLNTLIVSAVITFALIKFHDVKYLIFPAIVTLSFCLVSVTFAILATRPQIRPGTFNMDDFYNKKVSLIFYGNFFKMKYEDYERAVMDMLKDQDLLLSNLNRDQYTLGKILGRKFKLVNISYTIFLSGFVISVITFLVTLYYFNVNL